MKKILKKLMLSVVAMAVVLALVEICFVVKHGALRGLPPQELRVHDYFYQDSAGCFRIKPKVRGWHMSYDGGGDVLVKINSDGMRSPEITKDDRARIAFVGDSIVFNGGVPWTNTFTALLEERRAANEPDPARQWQCLDYGMSDLGIADYYLKLRDHALKAQPSSVVLGLYVNDSRPPQGFLGESQKVPLSQWLRRSLLYRLYTVRKLHKQVGLMRLRLNPEINRRFEWSTDYQEKTYLKRPEAWNEMVEKARYDWGAAWSEESWDYIGEHLGKIRDLCKEAGADLHVVMFPVSAQVEFETLSDDVTYPQRQARRLADEMGIAMTDLLPLLREHRGERIFADQCHLTSRGNQIVADLLYPRLSRGASITN